MAREMGISFFDAEVLSPNKAMLTVFERSELPIQKRFDDGVICLPMSLMDHDLYPYSEGGEVLPVVTNVTKEGDNSPLADAAIEKFGPISRVAPFAGIIRDGRINNKGCNDGDRRD
jgi:hypothetical protein